MSEKNRSAALTRKRKASPAELPPENISHLVPEATEAERDLVHKILAELNMSFKRAHFSGHDGFAGDPNATAARVVASIPRWDPLNHVLGPFYTTSSLTKWLDVTRQYVHELTKQRRILALTTADNVRVYPAFQFNDKGVPLPQLAEVLVILETGLEPWTQGLWLMTKAEELGDWTPANWMKAGRPIEPVLHSAQAYMDLIGLTPGGSS